MSSLAVAASTAPPQKPFGVGRDLQIARLFRFELGVAQYQRLRKGQCARVPATKISVHLLIMIPAFSRSHTVDRRFSASAFSLYFSTFSVIVLGSAAANST